MNLIIDQGNTATKLAIFNAEKKCVQRQTFSKEEIKLVENWIQSNIPEGTNVLISSVTNQVLDLSISPGIVVALSASTPIPLQNGYKTPATLGNDRLANAVAIWQKNPNQNSLCIDMGTCIKYDLVTAKGVYLGGNISPGMHMRYKALNAFTDKLPLIHPQDLPYTYGTTTETSLYNGVQHAIFHEINGFIQRYEQEFTQLTIFMTGGDLKYFDKGFKNTIFADSDLTIYGLNEILTYNVESNK